MEYSDLVEALRERDQARINEIINDLTPRLIKFLKIHMGASTSDAKDCVQQAFVHCLEIIREDRLRNSEKILTYLMTTCRNNYLKKTRENREIVSDEIHKKHFRIPGQLRKILDQERLDILEECLDELKPDYRTFIDYWFEHPDSDAEDVAEHFGITVNNTWTRKHRIIKRLNECYKRKIKL